MKRLESGFIQAIILILLASIGTFYFTLNKLGTAKDRPASAEMFQASASCNNGNFSGLKCVFDHYLEPGNCVLKEDGRWYRCKQPTGEMGYLFTPNSGSVNCDSACVAGETFRAHCSAAYPDYPNCIFGSNSIACVRFTPACTPTDPGERCELDLSCVPNASPTPTPQPTLTPPSPAPTPRVVSCNQTCNDSSYPPVRCSSGLICYKTSLIPEASGKCRNPECVTKTSCICTISTFPPTPTATPSTTPTATPTPTTTPTPTSEVTPTPTVTPTSTPNWCNGTCSSNLNCQSGYFCYNGFCRIPACRESSDCSCFTPTPTPPPVLGATAPPVLPKTGGGLGDIATLFGISGLGIYLIKRYKLI